MLNSPAGIVSEAPGEDNVLQNKFKEKICPLAQTSPLLPASAGQTPREAEKAHQAGYIFPCNPQAGRLYWWAQKQRREEVCVQIDASHTSIRPYHGGRFLCIKTRTHRKHPMDKRRTHHRTNSNIALNLSHPHTRPRSMEPRLQLCNPCIYCHHSRKAQQKRCGLSWACLELFYCWWEVGAASPSITSLAGPVRQCKT